MSLINQMLRDLESRNPTVNKPSSILHDNIKIAEAQGSKAPLIIGILLAFIATVGAGYWGYQHKKAPVKNTPIATVDNIKKDVIPPVATTEQPLPKNPAIQPSQSLPVTPTVQAAPVVQPTQPVQVQSTVRLQPEVVVEQPIKKLAIASKSAQVKQVSAKQQADLLYRQVENNVESYANVSKLEQVLKLDPRHLKARLLLAKTLHNQGQIIKTAEFLDQSLALFPDNLQFINTRAQIFLQQKNPSGALRTLQRVELTNNSNEAYLSLLAATYQQQQSFNNAASVYQRLVSVNSEKAENWLGLAISHEKLGNLKPAREAYQQALAKNTLKPSITGYIKQRLIELR